jgi:hypothetical protein
MDTQNRNLLEEMIEAAEATVGVDPVAGPVVIGENGEMVLTLSKKKTKKLKKLTVQSNFGPWGAEWVRRSRACEQKGMCDCEVCVPEVRSSSDEFRFEHTCFGCNSTFRCAPPVPRVRGLSPPSNRYCRCLAVGNGHDWFCSNRCFWMFHGQTRWY